MAAAMLGGQALAQTAAAPDPLSNGARRAWKFAADYVVRSAEKMPEENYSFKPTPEVFSFGQLIGHVAGAQSGACAAIAGTAAPDDSGMKGKTTKADLVAALKASVERCDAAMAKMTDANVTETVKMWGMTLPRLTAAYMVIGHTMEHYGNLITYLRMKGLVPPSSEPRK